MLFDKKKHSFDKFIENWNPKEEYIIYGASKDTPKLIDTLDRLLKKNTLNVSFIVDDNPLSKILYDYPIGSVSEVYKLDESSYVPKEFIRNRDSNKLKIISFLEFKKNPEINKKKIIIASDYNYKFYKEKLQNEGYIEDIDFCNYKKIAAIWPYKLEGLIHLWRTDILLTEKCSLDCTFCNMYMPHYKNQKHRDLEEIKLDIDTYFKKIDYVSIFHFVGGEPLLYPHVDEVIEYTLSKYKNQMGYFFITTNGTVSPKEKVLESMKRNSIMVHISDYTHSINYSRKLNQTKENLDKFKIPYLVRNDTSWTDFGDPNIEKFKNEDESIKHFDSCSAPFRGLNNLKYYYCHLNTSAVLSGMHKDDENNYVNLSDNNFNAENLLKLDLGFPPLGYVTFCKYCYGCNTKIGKKVSPKSQGLRQ